MMSFSSAADYCTANLLTHHQYLLHSRLLTRARSRSDKSSTYIANQRPVDCTVQDFCTGCSVAAFAAALLLLLLLLAW